MTSETSRSAQVFKLVSAVPAPSASTRLIDPQNSTFNIYSVWSSQDVIKVEKTIFLQECVVDRQNLNVISKGMACDMGSAILTTLSRNGKKQVHLKEKYSSESKFYIEVWNGLRKLATFDVNDKKEHGKICSNDYFKTFELSSDEKFLLYLAEDKQPKHISYFKDSSSTKEDEEKGEEYSYRQEWGEACVGVHHPVICMMDLETGKVEVLCTSQLGEDISVGEAKWGPNNESVVFVGWFESPYRLGIYACRNRRSALYSMDLKTKEIELLSPEGGFSVRCPRFCPDMSSLVYLQNQAGGPHFRGSQLMKYDWIKKKSDVIVDLVNSPQTDAFPGIYTDFLPCSGWSSNGKYFYLSSPWRSTSAILCVDVENRNVQKVDVGLDPDCDSASVIDVLNDIIIGQMSSPNVEPCLIIGRINEKGLFPIDWKYLDENAPVKHSDIQWKVVSLKPKIPNPTYPDLEYEIILIQPRDFKDKCPLIVIPHGGPHSVYTVGFPQSVISFTKLGYSICLVNYRGSVGFGESNLRSLLGNVGEQDVQDVHQAVEYVKNNYNIGDVYLYGGSHGGFLTAHLCGQYPDFYKAAALLNPVIDLCSMSGVTDIPDWCWVESGFGDHFDPATSLKTDHLKSMWQKSPIRYIENVKTPSLLLLGKKDLRVPYSQGLKYYQILKARNVPTKLYHYEDNHGLRKAGHDGDVFMQAFVWFQKHTSD